MLRYPPSEIEQEVAKFVYGRSMSLLADYATRGTNYGLLVKPAVREVTRLTAPHVLELYAQARSLGFEVAIEIAQALENAVDEGMDVLLCTATTAVKIPSSLVAEFLQEFADACGLERQ